MSTQDGRRDLYKDAGVDVDKGDRLVDWLKETDDHATQDQRRGLGGTVSGIGGFAALFRPDFRGMEDPLLVSGTDGVGTKVLLGLETGLLEGLGIDLVAMCVNDLYTIGARPLFFLDYYATGVLDESQFKAVLKGIKVGCRQSRAALLGGETAELPGLYKKGHFDLAGFVVGAVDGTKALGPKRVRIGDHLYGLASTGFHSNGYSLVRNFLAMNKVARTPELMHRLMEPTKIYHEVPALLEAVGLDHFHALANITGGGISGNLPRVMPPGVICTITKSALPTPAWMNDFISAHATTPLEQEAVFNLGVGMIASIAANAGSQFEAAAKQIGLDVRHIGVVDAGEDPGAEANVRFA